MLVNPNVDIALISLALACVSQLIQRKMLNRGEMKEKQNAMKEKNKRMRELMKNDDGKSKQELKALQKEIMEGTADMMSGSFKMMAVMMLIYLPVYWWLGDAFAGVEIPLPVPIPWFSADSLVALYSSTNWLGWYILTAMVFSFGLNGAINLAGRVKKARKNA